MVRNTYRAILVILTVVCVTAGTVYHLTDLFSSDGYAPRLGIDFEKDVDDDDNSGKKVSPADKLEAFTSIDIDISFGDIDIIAGDDYGYIYKGSRRLQPSCSVENGVLRIKDDPEYFRFAFNIFNIDGPNLTITVPADALLDVLTVDLDAGDLDIEDIKAHEMSVDLNAGDFDASDCRLDTISVRMDMGDADIEKCSFTDLGGSLSMGDISLDPSHPIDDYEIDLSCALGNVSFGGKDRGTKYSQDGSGGKIEIDCSMGSIEIH